MRQYEEALAAQAQANGADQHDSGASEEEDAVQQADKLFCVACDKSFRSEGAFRNHERCAGLPCSTSEACKACRSSEHMMHLMVQRENVSGVSYSDHAFAV